MSLEQRFSTMSMSPKTKDFPADDEDLHVEELTEDDAKEISELLALVWPQAKHIPLAWRQKRVLTPNQIINEMHQEFRYFGARINNCIAGFYKTILTPEGLLGEHQTVHPNYRHRGLVRAMYRQFINYAEQIGAPANLCNIIIEHETMRSLVEGFGFSPHGSSYEQAPGMLVQLYRRPTTPPTSSKE
jgi:hypothetical protein